MKKSIVWLASYPKSGNTWMRLFLANYLSNSEQPWDIKQVHRFGLGDSIAELYHKVARRQIDVQDQQLVLKLRDKVMRAIVANNADINFVKTHNIRARALGVPLIPDQYTRCGIHIVRNPMDMVLSYGRHFGLSPEDAVEAVNSVDNINLADSRTVVNYLGAWRDHVKSWESGSKFPVITVRYEDMLEEPVKAFGDVLNFIGIPPEQERLERAIKFSSFSELSKQEKDGGFPERSPNTDSFFSKGKSGQWKTDLAPELIKKIRIENKRMLKKYGYYNV